MKSYKYFIAVVFFISYFTVSAQAEITFETDVIDYGTIKKEMMDFVNLNSQTLVLLHYLSRKFDRLVGVQSQKSQQTPSCQVLRK